MTNPINVSRYEKSKCLLTALTKLIILVKCLEAELAPFYAQSAWGFKGERVRVAGLAICYNYFSKKKKN